MCDIMLQMCFSLKFLYSAVELFDLTAMLCTLMT